MYKLDIRLAKLSLLLISAYTSYFVSGYYEQSLYSCGVRLEGVRGLSVTSDKKLNVKIDIEMRFRKIYFIVDDNGTTAWKGVVNFSPTRDISGRVKSFFISSIEDGFILEGMKKRLILEQQYKEREIPFAIQPVDDSVYYVKLSNRAFFCINRKN